MRVLLSAKVIQKLVKGGIETGFQGVYCAVAPFNIIRLRSSIGINYIGYMQCGAICPAIFVNLNTKQY